MTALAQAMRDAGIVPASERLRALAKEAVRANPHNWDGARDAITKAVWSDLDLTREAFAPYHKQVINRLLSIANMDIQNETPKKPQPVMVQPSARLNSTHNTSYGSLIEKPTDDQRRESQKQANKTISNMIRLSILDTMRIGGAHRSIGDCTPEEIIAWAEKTGRDARVGLRLAAGMPPGKPIRNTLKPEEADAIAKEVSCD